MAMPEVSTINKVIFRSFVFANASGNNSTIATNAIAPAANPIPHGKNFVNYGVLLNRLIRQILPYLIHKGECQNRHNRLR